MKFPIDEAMPELGIAIKAALLAGKKITEIYKTEFKVKSKEDGSPVTEADKAGNDIISGILAESKHPILSEEGDHDTAIYDTVWIVDPLDGTADYIDRTGEFTIMIALVQNGTPVLGVIYWPIGDELYIAQEGKGAFRLIGDSAHQIKTSQTSELKYCSMVGSRHHLTDEEKTIIEKIGAAEFAIAGSSLKAIMVGRAITDAYLTTTDKMSEWDTAASYRIIKEAGGEMTDLQGNDLIYNKGDVRHHHGILMSNGILHKKILDILSS